MPRPMMDLSRILGPVNGPRARLYMTEDGRSDVEVLSHFGFLLMQSAGRVDDARALSNSLVRHALAYVAQVDELELRKCGFVEVVWVPEGAAVPEPRFEVLTSRLVLAVPS